MTNGLQSQVHEFGEFRVNAAKRLLLRDIDEIIPLTPKIFDTLLYFVQNSGKVIDKDELMHQIWPDTIVEENNLNKNISVLRRVLGEKPGEHRFIVTVPGQGYKFVADVREIEDAATREYGDAEMSEPPAVAGGLSAAELNISDRIAQIERQSEHDKGQSPMTEAQRKNRFWLRSVFGAFVSGLILLGFYYWRGNETSVVAPIKTIAVLPFKPLVAENRDEVLEIGMADTLIAQLGSNREIVVRPLSSVRKYGTLEQDAQTAGRELSVDSVVDGNIQRWGNKIRVNVRLVKVADGILLWTGTFDEKFTDIFVVQDTISKKVATALALRLSGDEQTRLEKRFTNNAEAYEFYLRGRFHSFKITPPEIRKAIGFYGQAIEADSGYAPAYAGMADAYRMQAIAAHAPSKEVCPQAKALAVRALEIDESLADAHIVLGWVGFLYDLDWESAERELQKAIELAPNNSEAHRAYAHLLSSSGRHEEAIAESKRARELDPLTLITATLDGYFLLYAGRYDEAIARLSKTLELDPNFWAAHNALGRVYLIQGRYDEAITAMTKAKDLSGGSTEPVTQLAYALAKSGRRGEAQAVMEELKLFAATNYVPMYFFAMIYNGLGEKEEALNYLDKTFQEREAQMTFIKIDTRWDNLQNEPRFVDLLKRIETSAVK